MEEVLVILASDKPKVAKSVQKKVEAGGGRIRQRYGPDVWIIEADKDLLKTLPDVRGVAGAYTGQVSDDHSSHLGETGQLGIAAWNQRQSAAFHQSKQDRKGEGLEWDHPDYDREGSKGP